MKRSLCISLIAMLSVPGILTAQNYKVGDVLHVVASSGLRLRTSPGSQSGTIRVLECGESVVVQNTFNFDSTYRDKSGWLSGNWIYVINEDVEGYVFDAYLTSLSLPTHENELCLDSPSFSEPLHNYFKHHYPMQTEEQGNEHGELIDQCVMYHQGGIIVTQTQGTGWHKTDIVFEGYRVTEVLNLFRSMLVGNEMREQFDGNLIFHKNKTGRVHRIQNENQSYILRIEERSDGSIQASLTDLTKVDRC